MERVKKIYLLLVVCVCGFIFACNAGVVSAMEQGAKASSWLVKPVPVAGSNPEYKMKEASPVRLSHDELLALPLGGDKPEIRSDLYFEKSSLSAFSQILEKDSRIKATWSSVLTGVANTLEFGRIKSISGNPERYIYSASGKLPRLAFVYLVTGDKRIGEFVRKAVLDSAARPIEFWIHSALRKFEADWPVGQLETGQFTAGVAIAYNWTYSLYTKEERKFVEENLRVKGLYPCMRWLEKPTVRSNFICIIAGGAIAAARVLGDDAALAKAKAMMTEWLDLLEDDGSYGEPLGYFDYALLHFLTGVMVLGKDELYDMVAPTPLSKTFDYYQYNYMPPVGGDKKASHIVNFGDDDFVKRPSPPIMQFFACAFGQAKAAKLIERYYDKDERLNFYCCLLSLMYPQYAETLQEEKDVPSTVRAFDNGLAYIRSGWGSDTKVLLALRSGDGGRSNYVHDRANRNAIGLNVNGEYMLVAPGRACYRSPLFRIWDRRTDSHNTITFERENQKSRPVAKVTAVKSIAQADYLASEAKDSYGGNVQSAIRRVLYIKDPGYFLVWDHVKVKEGKSVDWNMHFGNSDGQGKFVKIGNRMCAFERPHANLVIGLCANAETVESVEDGIMHRGYSYFAGGKREGEWGTSKTWRVSTAEKVSVVDFCSIIFPSTASKSRVPIFEMVNNLKRTEKQSVGMSTGEFRNVIADEFVITPDAAEGEAVITVLRKHNGKEVDSFGF